jgi:predicted amino acid-binding ACT domain protein
MKRKIFKGTFSLNLTVTAYDEEQAIDKLYERLDEAIHNQELWVEDYALHEQEIEEVSPHD